MEAVTTIEKRKLGVHEAKRWLSDSMGYYVVRNMLRDEELLNKSWSKEFKRDGAGWVDLTFVIVGNHTLALNHTEYCLEWQE